MSLREDMERTLNEFAGALDNMQQHAVMPEPRDQLTGLELQWEWVQSVLEIEGAESYRVIMAEAGETALQLAENIVLSYQDSPQ